MNSFINNCARDIYNKYTNNLHELIIVFPNKRPAVFFTKELSQYITKPILMPQLKTINELFEVHSKLVVPESLHLLILLYEVYKEKTSLPETFDDFFFWGEMILNDFDDIDKYLINAKDMFQNIASIKDIDKSFEYLSEEQIAAISKFWSCFDFDHLTQHQTDFLSIWDILHDIYIDFKNLLLSKGLAYEGMLTRKVIESLKKEIDSTWTCRKYIFIGFNALNKCEEVLFQKLNDAKVAEFYWDYDNYYINDSINESGLFIRKNLKNLPISNKHFDFDNILKNKKIKITASPNQTSQIKYLTELLSDIENNKNDYSETAIILANENFLIPVLYSIPENIKKINVTMGYPLSISPIYSFIETLLELQKNYNNKGFYHKDIIAVLSNNIVGANYTEEIKNLKHHIISNNVIRVDAEKIKDSKLFKVVFRKIENGKELIAYILDIIHFIIKENIISLFTNIENEFYYKVFTTINNLKSILEMQNIIIDDKILAIKFVKKTLSQVSIPFEGEPLDGLQILGVLETRLLDFKNIIILSLNEGIFPKGKLAPSFIPYNIRTGFGIPTLKHQDAIFSYYFYRLLQRAENINLLYAKQISDEGKGEMSRYISQLKFSNDFCIEEDEINVSISSKDKEEIIIEKNDNAHKTKLDKYYNSQVKLSPTALNTYLSCKLMFFFKYIEGLKEVDEVNEIMDDAMFGNIFHNTIEKLYTPYINKVLQKETIEKILYNKELIKSSLQETFRECVFEDNKKNIEIDGYNEIVISVLQIYIYNTLKRDIENTPFTIVGLEKKIETTIETTSSEKITLYGNIDRIDLKDGIYKIIDYKTGNGQKDFNLIEDLFKPNSDKRNKNVLQALFYSYIYIKENTNQKISPCLYFIREQYKATDIEIEIKNGEKNKTKINDFNIYFDEFENLLKNSINDIFDKSIPFTQTENEKICAFCDFKIICKK